MKNQISSGGGQRLNQLEPVHLAKVLSMAVAERSAFENARDNYFESSAVARYNDVLSRANLTNYCISQSHLTFVAKEVKDVWRNRISELSDELEQGHHRLEKDWKESSQLLYEHMTLPRFNQTLDKSLALEEVKTQYNILLPRHRLGRGLTYLICFYFLIKVARLIFALSGYGYGDNFPYLTLLPLKVLLLGEKAPYDRSDFLRHSLWIDLGVGLAIFVISWLIVSIIWGIVSSYDQKKRDDHLNQLADVKATEWLQQARLNHEANFKHDRSVIYTYSQKSFSDFYRQGQRELFNGYFNQQTWQRLVSQYQKGLSIEEKLKELQSIEFDNLVDSVFQRYDYYCKQKEIYDNRIAEGNSMEMIIPEPYRDIDTLALFYRLLIEGRAESWKEVVNLSLDDNYKQKMLVGIEQVSNGMSGLRMEIARVGSDLERHLEESLDRLSDSIEDAQYDNAKMLNRVHENQKSLENIQKMSLSKLDDIQFVQMVTMLTK